MDIFVSNSPVKSSNTESTGRNFCAPTELIFTKHTWPNIFFKELQYWISWPLTNGLVIASRSLWDGWRWSPHKAFLISFIKNIWKVSFCLKEYTACPLHWQSGKWFMGKWSLFIVRITDTSNTVGGQMQFLNVPVGGTCGNYCSSWG